MKETVEGSHTMFRLKCSACNAVIEQHKAHTKESFKWIHKVFNEIVNKDCIFTTKHLNTHTFGQ